MNDQPILSTRLHERGLVAVVTCAEFDHERTAQLKADYYAAVLQYPDAPLVLDLSQVAFLASLTLGALVEMANHARKDKRRFVLVGLSPTIREMMKKSALEPMFELQQDVTSALN